MRRLLAVLAAVGAMLALNVGPAQAATHGGDYHNGNFQATAYLGEHSLTVIWKSYFSQPGHDKNQVNLSVDAGNLPAGKCVQAAYDWHNYGGHYDPRIVRVCKSGGHREAALPGSIWYTEDGSWCGGVCSLDMHQVQFAMYDVSSGWLSSPVCISEDQMGGVNVDRICDGIGWSGAGGTGVWAPSPSNTCAGITGFRLWIRRSDGSADLCTGGNPTSQDTKRLA